MESDTSTSLNRAEEVSTLVDAVKSLIVPFIRTADEAAPTRASGANRRAAVNPLIQGDLLPAKTLHRLLQDILPEAEGLGLGGLQTAISQILKYSVNTWDQGFLDKLYSSPNPVGVIAETLLAVLNTNLHVYTVSPALTIVEKITASSLASLCGFSGPHAGGVTVPGGSAGSLTSLVIARSVRYPNTKACGNGVYEFVVFASEHAHYSLEKAAVTCGIGKNNVWHVPADEHSSMNTAILASQIKHARKQGFTPLYVNATAGTTVLGAFDDLEGIAAVCKAENIWMHVDASWGGSLIFSSQHRHKLRGLHLADSVAMNPHKMMNVPVTCSFLLGPDIRLFHKANKAEADYLFHAPDEDNGEESYDLADMTLQCGRKGDGLKLALSWIYYGPQGFGKQIDGAFEHAAFLAAEIEMMQDFALVSENPPPCLQVCFYYKYSESAAENSKTTVEMARRLRARGFMIDYASFPGSRKDSPRGSFLRVVVNIQTRKETLTGLMSALVEVASETTRQGQTSMQY